MNTFTKLCIYVLQNEGEKQAKKTNKKTIHLLF